MGGRVFRIDFNCAKTLATLSTAAVALGHVAVQLQAGVPPDHLNPLTAGVALNLLANGLTAICSLRHFRAGKEREETLANHDIVHMIKKAWGEASVKVLRTYLMEHVDRSAPGGLSVTTVSSAALRNLVLKPEDFACDIDLRTIRDTVRAARQSLLPESDVPRQAEELKKVAIQSILEVLRGKLGDQPLPEDLETFLAGEKGIVFQLAAHTALYLKTNDHAQIAVLHFTLQEAEDRQKSIEAVCESILAHQTEQEQVYFKDLEARFKTEIADLHAHINEKFNEQQAPPLATPFDDQKTGGIFTYRARKTPFTGRQPAMDALEDFLLAPGLALWTVISGPAGTGKSRLAAELMAKASTWHTGFVTGAREWLPEKSLHWQRSNDTLLVFDYAGDQNADHLRTFLARLAVPSKAAPDSRLRVILIDRLRPDTPQQGIDAKISTTSDFSDAAKALRWSSPANVLHLEPVSSEDALQIAAGWAGDKWSDAARTRVDQAIQQDAELARPLFAFLMGDAICNGDLPHGILNPVSVASTALDRVFTHEQTECLEEAKMLWAAATACQGVKEEHLLSKAALQELLDVQLSPHNGKVYRTVFATSEPSQQAASPNWSRTSSAACSC